MDKPNVSKFSCCVANVADTINKHNRHHHNATVAASRTTVRRVQPASRDCPAMMASMANRDRRDNREHREISIARRNNAPVFSVRQVHRAMRVSMAHRDRRDRVEIRVNQVTMDAMVSPVSLDQKATSVILVPMAIMVRLVKMAVLALDTFRADLASAAVPAMPVHLVMQAIRVKTDSQAASVQRVHKAMPVSPDPMVPMDHRDSREMMVRRATMPAIVHVQRVMLPMSVTRRQRNQRLTIKYNRRPISRHRLR